MLKKVFTSFFFLLTATQLIGQSDWPYDYLQGSIAIKIDPLKEQIQGRVKYRMTSLYKVDSVYLDAQNMQIEEVRFNGQSVHFKNDGKKLIINKTINPGKKYRLDITYSTQPKQTVYFLGWKDSISGNEQVWTQGQGKYSSHWVPSPDEM
ncbi:MAG: M1 family peptidase, partial [Eudoraea sp.]|nr:M1 family peptidase [Eudoraea sp.]